MCTIFIATFSVLCSPREHRNNGGPNLQPCFQQETEISGKLKVAQRVPSPSGHRNENQHKANRRWDVNVRCWKYIKLKAFGLVNGWVVCCFFFFSFVHWHLTPFIICTLHCWNPVSYLLNSGTNGWLVPIRLLTAWCCPCAEERGMKGNCLCCEILSYRQKGAAKSSNLYLTSDLRSLCKPLKLGLKLRNKVYKYKEEISSTRYLCPGLIL